MSLWRRLTDHGISRAKPTRRGYRGGIRKRRALHQLQNLQAEFSRDHFRPFEQSIQEESSIIEEGAHLHNGSRETLNIQDDTFGNGTLNNHPEPQDPARNASSNIDQSIRDHFVPKILTNVMSLAPKIVEVSEFTLRNDVDLACITET